MAGSDTGRRRIQRYVKTMRVVSKQSGRFHAALYVLVGLVLVLSFMVSAQSPDQGADKSEKKKASDSATTALRIEITAGDDSKPVDQASVYVKYMEERSLRRDKKIELNLKTNRDGVARLDDAPRGKVLIQVIAPGWKTFGKWFELAQDEQTIKIQLQKPPRWY